MKSVPSPIFDANSDKFKLRIITLNQVFNVTFKNIVVLYLKPGTERNEGRKKTNSWLILKKTERVRTNST